MSEAFKQHFAKTPEQKSPKQIKREKGSALAEEIKKIQERMTIEGYQRIIELTQEITEIFESLMRGEILDFLLEMEKIHGIKIKDAKDIHSQPDGTLAGLVQLSNGRWVPFQGDKLLKMIGGEEIKSAGNIHSQPDGTLAGVVQLSNGRWVFFQGDKLLEKIGGEEIKDVKNVHSQPDGTLAGKVQLSNYRWINFFWDGERVYSR
jgi:hypothetical protein